MARTRVDQEAVSPIVGTLLILAITVIGMAGIMIWGAPTIEAVQAQNAQVGIVGEFEELRSASIDLSIPDASRIPTVNVPRGVLAIEAGTRVMVAATHVNGCSFQVRGWGDTAAATVDDVTYAATGCTGAYFEVLEVVGSNTVQRAIETPLDGAITVAGQDLSEGDWLFRVTDGATDPTVYAQAWLLDSDAITWRLGTSGGGVAAFYDLGAVFSEASGAYFMEKSASLQEDEFGSGVYALRLRALSDAGGTSAITGRGSHQVFLGLVGNHVRIDEDVYTLRYEFQGELAESWCNVFEQRNNDLTGAAYTPVAPSASCDASTEDGIRAVTYARTVAPLAFEAEVLHAIIRTTLSA